MFIKDSFLQLSSREASDRTLQSKVSGVDGLGPSSHSSIEEDISIHQRCFFARECSIQHITGPRKRVPDLFLLI